MAERFRIDKVVSIFDNDSELIQTLSDDSLYPLELIQKERLAEVLIDGESYSNGLTVNDLVSENYLKSDISSIISSLSDELYKQILYTFKYASVKMFFRDNYAKFLPPYDVTVLQDGGQRQIFIEAFMREFDKFSGIIDDIYNIVDLEKVPLDYINYLGQLIGYERKDYLLISDISFRELLKNMIEIYKIKGTNYSFELFFGFLGFDITVQEFWFDKRYGDPDITSNEFTNTVSQTNYLFYLTPIKPTTRIIDGMRYPYAVNEESIKQPLDLNMFQKYIDWHETGDTRGYSNKELIGDTEGFEGDTYTFFKTNIIQYSLESLRSNEEVQLSDDDLNIIELYVNFLTPVFVSTRVLLASAPFSEQATYILFFKDDKRSDPVFYRNRIFPITKIDAYNGDIGDSAGIIYVGDSYAELYNFVHIGDRFYVGDTTSFPIGDSDNIGFYYVAGDTNGDSHAFFLNSQTRIKTKEPFPGADQNTGGGYLFIGGPDYMFHTYEGTYPGNYYWGDTELGDSWEVSYHDANIPGRFEYWNFNYGLKTSRGMEPYQAEVNKRRKKLDWRHGDSLLISQAFFNTYTKIWNSKENTGTVAFWDNDSRNTNIIFSLGDSAWTAYNSTLTRQEYFLGNYEMFTITGNDTSTSAYAQMQAPVSGSDFTLQSIVRKGTNTKSKIALYDSSASTERIGIEINYTTKTVSLSNGDTLWYEWLNESQDTVWVAASTSSVVDSNTNVVRIYGQYDDTVSTAKYGYAGAVQLQASLFPSQHSDSQHSDSQHSDSEVQENLVLHLAMDQVYKDGGSYYVADASGNGNTATAMSMTSANEVSGVSGNALDFDGSADYLTVADDATLQFGTGDFAISFWVKFDDADLGLYQFLFDKRTANTFSGIVIYRNAAIERISFLIPAVVGSSWATTLSDSAINDTSSFHHIVCQRDDGSTSMWIDGVKQADTESTSASVSDGTYDIHIGSNWENAAKTNGKIDEFRIYDTALTEAQIKILYDLNDLNDLNTTKLVYKEKDKDGNLFSWPSAGSIEFYMYPHFSYADSKSRIIFSDGDSSGNWGIRFIYDSSVDMFRYAVSDDGGTTIEHIDFGASTDNIWEAGTAFISNEQLNKWLWIKLSWDTHNEDYRVWVGDSGILYEIGSIPIALVGDTIPFNNYISIGSETDEDGSTVFSGLITDFIFYKELHNNTSHFYENKPYYYPDNTSAVFSDGYNISGDYIDTQRKLFDRSYVNSAYNKIKSSNPLYNQEQIYEEMNRISYLGDSGLFKYTTYGIHGRDMLIFVDTTRKIYGDSVFGHGDTFTKDSVGDSILYFGDSHEFEANRYLFIDGDEYLITSTGDTWITIYPFIGDSGIAFPKYSYFDYYSSNDGDSLGDSAFSLNSGFINTKELIQFDLNSVSDITLGSNIPLEVNEEGRPFENQDIFSKERKNYYKFNYTSASGSFYLGEKVAGGTTGAQAIISSFGGDSIFYSIHPLDGNFLNGETITGDSSSTTATLSSFYQYTDKRGRILSIDVLDTTVGKVQVYDPMNGDSFNTTEFNSLTSDSYVYLYGVGDTTVGEYRVSSTARGAGDTVVITFGDSLPGSDQGDSGGYIIHVIKAFIKEIEKVGSGDSKGTIYIYDKGKKFLDFIGGDSIQIYGRGDTNDGYYYLFSDATHADDITTIRIGDSFPGASGDSGGFIKIKSGYWDFGDSHFPFDFDYFELIKTHI
jgi:hypothetical protein